MFRRGSDSLQVCVVKSRVCAAQVIGSVEDVLIGTRQALLPEAALALLPSVRLATRWHSAAGVCCLVGCAAWCAALQRLEPDTWRARGVGLKRREEP